MFLFIDTETTGMVDFNGSPGDAGQPRIVQVGAVLADAAQRVLARVDLLIRPRGWAIPPAATAVHGITTPSLLQTTPTSPAGNASSATT